MPSQRMQAGPSLTLPHSLKILGSIKNIADIMECSLWQHSFE
jgi:hypothetical protein